MADVPTRMRDEFEAWCLSHKLPPDILEEARALGPNYGGNGLISGTWNAWQAAAAAEREKARGLVEALKATMGAIETLDLDGHNWPATTSLALQEAESALAAYQQDQP